MVGNDIVDINEARNTSNWKRSRFLDKIYTKDEQSAIRNASNSFIKVWQLWSMKEAAYKLYTQVYPSRFYNPKGFECFIKKDYSIVKFEDFKCYVTTKITSEYIISEARLNSRFMTSKVIKFENKNANNQSEIIRKTVIQKGADICNTSKEGIKISTSKYGTPSITIKSKTVPISLTHHGNYGAYAFS